MDAVTSESNISDQPRCLACHTSIPIFAPAFGPWSLSLSNSLVTLFDSAEVQHEVHTLVGKSKQVN